MPFLNIFFGADFVQIPLIFDKDFGSYLNLVPKKSIWYSASALLKRSNASTDGSFGDMTIIQSIKNFRGIQQIFTVTDTTRQDWLKNTLEISTYVDPC